MVRFGTRTVAVLATVCLAGCSPPLKVGAIQVGRSLNADQSIATLSTTFTPHDTIHVSVLTTARGKGTIGVKWYFGTQLLSEREKQVTFQGASATEFNIKSASGFPLGDYTVEAVLDGQSVGRRNFDVVK